MVDFIIKYWIEVLMGILLMGITALALGFAAVFQGVKALLRDRLIQIHSHYTEKGFCPIYALENAHGMYKAYKALHGNGTVTQLMDELEHLPRKERK